MGIKKDLCFIFIYLIKKIHMSLTKVLIYKGGNQEKPRILILEPTSVAAININGTNIHTSRVLHVGGKLYPLTKQGRIMQQTFRVTIFDNR